MSLKTTKGLIAITSEITLTNPHWAHVVSYGLFFLWVIHKEGLCPSGGAINRLMMMMMMMTPEMDCDQKAMGLPPVTSVFLIIKLFL
jgi:hypothetical protein